MQMFIFTYTFFLISFVLQVFPPARRPPRPAEFGRDSAYESRRTSQFSGGISLDNFRFISVLGRGHFGKVSECTYMKTLGIFDFVCINP